MRSTALRALPFALLVITGAAAAAGAVVGHRASLEPHAFSAAGGVTVGSDVVVVGQPTWVGLTYPDTDVVDVSRDDGERARITEARPRVVRNSAQADIALEVCVIDRQARVGSLLVAPDRQALDGTCARTLPLDSRPLRLSGGYADQVVARITPRQPGVVQVEGLDLTYSYGGREGTEHVGVGVQLGR